MGNGNHKDAKFSLEKNEVVMTHRIEAQSVKERVNTGIVFSIIQYHRFISVSS